MPTKEQDVFISGAIFSLLGLYVIIDTQDLKSGFFLLGVGIIIMSSSSKELRGKVFNFFFSIFKGIWEVLSKR